VPGLPAPSPAHLHPPEDGRFPLRPVRHLLKRISFALIATGAVAGCGPAAPMPGSIRIVDDAGDTVALARPARRIVSLIPASTELLFALGAGAQVVGRTTWCDYPAEALAVPNLGDGLQPNLEAVLAATPDLVVLYHSTQNAAAAGQLRAHGIAVVQLATDRLADVPRHARTLGTLLGRADAADSLSARYARALAGVDATDPGGPSVLILAWDQPPIAIGAGSFLSELVERAGGRNLFADLASASAPVSLEAIAARNPDLILVVGEESPGFAARPEWQVVGAVRERRFVSVHGSEFSRPGPRSPAAIRALRTAIAETRSAAAR
jgi:iron complex transport system substrate-binding protein